MSQKVFHRLQRVMGGGVQAKYFSLKLMTMMRTIQITKSETSQRLQFMTEKKTTIVRLQSIGKKAERKTVKIRRQRKEKERNRKNRKNVKLEIRRRQTRNRKKTKKMKV